jgi:hypothetical protein
LNANPSTPITAATGTLNANSTNKINSVVAIMNCPGDMSGLGFGVAVSVL